MSSGKNGDFFDDSCLLACILGLVFMPVMGVYFLVSDGSSDRKLLGVVLTVVGSFLWFVVGEGR